MTAITPLIALKRLSVVASVVSRVTAFLSLAFFPDFLGKRICKLNAMMQV